MLGHLAHSFIRWVVTFDLEIVPHIWGYARTAAWQLSSLVQFPPKCRVLYRPCVTAEDEDTMRLLRFFCGLPLPPTLAVEPHLMDRRRLMRRCIGRNECFLSSKATVIWASDCDYLCGPGDLDAILERFPTGAKVAHPDSIHATSWPDGMAMIEAVKEPAVLEIDLGIFNQVKHGKPIGGLQFVAGDYARAFGYCADELGWKRMGAADRWMPTKCDRKYRMKAGGSAPIPGPLLYRLRHDVRSEGNEVDVRL